MLRVKVTCYDALSVVATAALPARVCHADWFLVKTLNFLYVLL